MNVQELIDILSTVKDKNTEVVIFNNGWEENIFSALDADLCDIYDEDYNIIGNEFRIVF